MKPALVFSLLVCGGALAEEQPSALPRGAAASGGAIWRAAAPKPVELKSKTVVAPLPSRKPAAPSDELRTLGDLKALDVREGEALLRVDGVERTIRPGMRLRDDVVQSITPQRMVLLRPKHVDEKKGEALVIVDFLGPGRSRVRTYASRDWTARPPRSAE